MVQWLRLCAFLQQAWVWFLVHVVWEKIKSSDLLALPSSFLFWLEFLQDVMLQVTDLPVEYGVRWNKMNKIKINNKGVLKRKYIMLGGD